MGTKASTILIRIIRITPKIHQTQARLKTPMILMMMMMTMEMMETVMMEGMAMVATAVIVGVVMVVGIRSGLKGCRTRERWRW